VPDDLVVAAILAIGALSALVLGMYGGGGTAAARRQLPQIAVIVAVLIVTAFTTPLLLDAFGWAWVGLLLVLSALVLLVFVRQFATTRPAAEPHARPTGRPTAFGILVIVWAAVLVMGAVAAFAVRSGA
jgi:hypothetical protein